MAATSLSCSRLLPSQYDSSCRVLAPVNPNPLLVRKIVLYNLSVKDTTNMTTQTKWIIGIASLIALLAITAPIYYYVNDFHELPRSSKPSDWGTFGDFFGGILNPILSLLTLIVTIIIAVHISKIEKRNHDETVHSPVKPLFTIGTGEFFSSDISRNGQTIERDFYDYEPPQQPAGSYDYLSKQFYLKVFNKGLGIATDINAVFELNLDELKSLLIIDDPKIKVTTSDLKTDEDGRKSIVLNIQSKHFNYHGSSKIWAMERYGLGVIDKGEEVKAGIPSQMIGAFKLYNLVRRLKGKDETFPTIFVTFSYKNIHGRSLSAKFRVGLFHIHDYGHYSMFKILQEQI